ncbi:omptin family outer membrane protease [Bosea sp. (in: a-proteobacteria)]|uniref:omptin family outer membrane protease n=1 Tax=Bosea sp. (in: a-proteobacteria) TaxID=1871050 RepID=UPI003B3B18E1
MLHRFGWPALGLALAAATQPASAQGLFDSASLAAPAPSGEIVSFTPSIGILRGKATELVYDPTSGEKLSQLDWKSNATTVGGRLAVRPLESVTLRGSLWAAVSGDGDMTDRDWLYGYFGKDSWSHQSTHPDTRVGKAWQGDISLSYLLLDSGDMAFSALAGYRHYDIKHRAYGGDYIYSVYGYRDVAGSFDPGVMGIAYRQVWDTPYLGFGAYFRGDRFNVSTEFYGSPITFGRDQDYHGLRYTSFNGRFTPTAMVGANLAVEYQLTPNFSLVGRADYTRYSEAKGNTRIYDAANGAYYRIPRPSSGADSQTVNLTLGVKGKI